MKKKSSTISEDKQKSKPFPIVAIGASAGGIEAMTELLKNLPSNTGMAYVYIQHLNPSHESMLASILGRSTGMTVIEASESLPLNPDHLYIIPPDKDLFILDGVLGTIPRKAKPAIHLPIDKFFISLAEKQKEASIGIILSGNASDGTLGLKAIKSAGGITFAQDETAKFQGMPKSAIAEGVVDAILSPANIAKELERISQKAEFVHEMIMDENEAGINNADENLLSILETLKRFSGTDFSHYKMNTIKRRILRRMLLYKLDSLKDYVEYIKKNTKEAGILYNDLLINVTNFFRDADAFEYLKKTLFPSILKGRTANDPVRIWIPACSTGEEAYSIAIVMIELLTDIGGNIPIQIFATDLSDIAIAKARLAVYSINDVAEISERRLQRFFNKIDGSYRIVKQVRDVCVFAPHNIFKDPPFSRIDFISCCNLMIYLDTVLQKKMIATFHYALNNTGYLMLGKSETVGAGAQLFTQLEKKFKVYAKRKDATSGAILEMTKRVKDPFKQADTIPNVNISKNSKVSRELDEMVDNILLTRYIPASVVINHDFEILQFRGSTGLFLEPSPGKASLNLLKMARPGLVFELRNAVNKANRTHESVSKSGIAIKHQKTSHIVSLEVIPLESKGEDKQLLVILEEIKPASYSAETNNSATRDKTIEELHNELNSLKDDMRAMLEEQEAHMEELQSANEEIVSSNEELQSVNEELETSKEEVESINEELMTMNTELQIRNEQLTEAYDYADAIFHYIGEAVLILDVNFIVKSVNKSFYRIFKFNEEDTIGNLVFELGDQAWNILKLRELLERVVTRNEFFENFEITNELPEVGQKTLLISARKISQKTHKKELILIAIQDITEQNKVTRNLIAREAALRKMADEAPVMIWTADSERLFINLNKTWLEFTGKAIEHQKGMGWTQFVHPDDLGKVLKVYNSAFDDGKEFSIAFRLKGKTGEYKPVLMRGRPEITEQNLTVGFNGVVVEDPGFGL